MKPRIEISKDKKLVGQRLKMSAADYKVGELWKRFMPRRKEITNNLTNDLISLVVYKSTHFLNFTPTNEFERWASAEVPNFDNVPTEMEQFDLQGGLYAVFDYKGLNTDNSIFQYILGTWLPNSDFDLDNRPHFEVLGDRYKNNDPNSEEEIWIPIKEKQKPAPNKS
ncbi:MAG: AraC family transcriptional regulator [Aureispira sp.]|jgi:AraC family transcriptional regulator